LQRAISITFLLLLSVGVAQADKATPADVANAVKEIVERDFYRPVTFPTLPAEGLTTADIDRALASLGTSHTARFEPGTIDYVELVDILRYSIHRDLDRLFPSKGEPSYSGIGVVTRDIDGRTFVSDVYDGTPAASSGIKVGDEVLAVDGQPFGQLESIAVKAGRIAKINVRRSAEAKSQEIPVLVTRILPTQTFSDAISKSMKIVDEDGLKIAYFRLWALGSRDIEENITEALKTGALKDADGLVVDLRGRWGGMFGQVPDLLTYKTPEITFTERGGKTSFAAAAYDKPVVGLIDEGTRSAQEMFAALLRKQGAVLVGAQTPGAVLGARAYILPDDSLLILPTSEVRIDGELLEGKGVAPDVKVDFHLPYAAGADPQLKAALAEMKVILCGPTGQNAKCQAAERPVSP
jgi:carboxyl-terminal processing protease